MPAVPAYHDCRVDKFPMGAPDDVSGLEKLIRGGAISPSDIIGVVAKTEGNGRVNDFSRPLALRRFRELICRTARWSERELDAHVSFVMSGGCEGIIAPHAVVFSKRSVAAKANSRPSDDKRLTIGRARTRELKPEEVGTPVQSALVAAAVGKAQRDATIRNAADVHFVFVKGPLLTAERILQAANRGKGVVTASAEASLVYSNGASALGVASALKDVLGQITQGLICRDASLYTTRSGASAGIELMHCEILLLGNSPLSHSQFVTGHHELSDLIDAEGVRRALASVGAGTEDGARRSEVICAFGKGHIPADGRLRGWRTTLLTDSDLGPWPARAVLGSVIASVIGDPAVYVSAGIGFHEGPPGGGSIAVIARVQA